jgi:cupin 2 domain-containing protein
MKPSSAAGAIYSAIPQDLPNEIVETLVNSDTVKIERIVSHGQHSPPGFWYDQDRSEWVLLLKGEAGIRFEDRIVHMTEGMYINIAAHEKHRVEWTSKEMQTVWLAVYYRDQGAD